MIADICITSNSPIQELANMASGMIFNIVSDEEKYDFRFFFSIINIKNMYWHLLVLNMQWKFIHLNSLKQNAKQKASARKWQQIVGSIMYIYYDNAELIN